MEKIVNVVFTDGTGKNYITQGPIEAVNGLFRLTIEGKAHIYLSPAIVSIITEYPKENT